MLRFGIISTLIAFFGVQVACADTPYWQSDAFLAATDVCVANRDSVCVYNNTMQVMEGYISLGETCATDTKGEANFQFCFIAMMGLLMHAQLASHDVVPLQRRRMAERFLQFLDDFKVAEAYPSVSEAELLVPFLLSAHALRLDACEALGDVGCVDETATNIIAIAGDRSPEAVNALRWDNGEASAVTPDLAAIINKARDVIKGSQP